ncbi:lipopolysaccharide biosynthesis protein [Methylomonas sp. EFPC3]|uniref:Wzz/FepE/Etk N-terminal domain-containing protein n=1 Tax=Methylomonas sp. EFPC3 TaxID=3021710 RepID=UPI00241692D3|nr:Wzz/FepE/Etk N-terminal domain-containing protein [Methylomonas sp. EFPC3]WFP51155.1 lipopolysaccharide biosynthesis protein [Methylomonas sp. EFPC3]
MENQTIDIKDYLKIIKRRRRFLLIPFIIIVLASILLAVLLPAKYRSSATILIEAQEIPADLVHSTVTTFAEQRIQMISQRIMTRPNLTEIIKKYNLYAAERLKKPEEVILEKMRSLIKVETISADVGDQKTNRATQATIAFTLTFEDKSAELAQKVANELTSLFLKENIKSRTESAENAALFLSEESKRLKAKIQEIQEKLATFKEKNLNQLPQISALNQQELTSLSNQLLSLDSQERSLQDRRFYLEGELAQIDPNAMATNAVGNRVFDMKDRLKELQSQYPSLIASFSANHPDVIKVKREIESLQKEIGSNADINNLNAELTQKKAELALLLKQYSEKHPDVVKLQKQITALQKSLVDAKANEYSNSSIKPDNPAYITLKSQLDSVNTEIESLNYTRGRIQSKIEDLRNNLRQSPLVEKEYSDLIQDLDNTNLRYREVSAREMEAQISQQLEIERKGERFTLIDPPQEPLEPVSPNRVAILLLGIVLATASGFGSVALAEMLDPTLNSAKAVGLILGFEPLAAIPYLENQIEFQKRATERKMLIGGLIAAFLLGMAAFHFIIMPLDVFWYKLLRVIGN